MLYFNEERYDSFLDLVVETQKERYNVINLFRRSEIYYRSQDDINILKDLKE